MKSEDLGEVDIRIIQFMSQLQELKLPDSDSESAVQKLFADYSREANFTTLLSDNTSADLLPYGRTIPVTSQNKAQWIALCEKKLMHEGTPSMQTILAGISDIIPVHLFSLFTHAEMQYLMCGSPNIDLDRLERECTYESKSKLSSDSVQVRYLWQTLRELTDRELVQFVSFCKGSSRLQDSDKLSITLIPERKDNRDAFPAAQTCFFQLKLGPVYTSQAIFKQKLVEAIFSSSGMDLQ